MDVIDAGGEQDQQEWPFAAEHTIQRRLKKLLSHRNELPARIRISAAWYRTYYVKAPDKAANEIVRAKLRSARRPCSKWAVVPQTYVAELAGVSQALVSRFESSKMDLGENQLRSIERALVEIGRRRTTDGFRLLADAV